MTEPEPKIQKLNAAEIKRRCKAASDAAKAMGIEIGARARTCRVDYEMRLDKQGISWRPLIVTIGSGGVSGGVAYNTGPNMCLKSDY